MLFSKIKDKRFRFFYNKIEHKKKIYKYIKINLLSSFCYKQSKKIKLKQYFNKVFCLNNKKFYFLSNVKIVRRCLFNNRSRSVLKNYGLSRNVFRELLQFGIIPGYKKAVW